MNKKASIPENEEYRLDALLKYNILDTLPEDEFDRLTQLASIICGVPIALISLIDENRQWFKSKVGLDAQETPRDISFCQYSIGGNSIFEVEDATKDERFLSNPLVIENPNIRFYAGYPLIDPEGYALGTLCVIDRQARKLMPAQQQALTLLANEVVSQIVSRKKNAEKDKLETLFNLSIDMICVAGTDGYFKKINPAFSLTLGWTIDELLAKPFFEFIHPDDVTATFNEIEKLSHGEKTVGFENRFITKNGDYILISWVANPDKITGELYAIGRNDSDRIIWEQTLLLSEEKHRGFYENSQGLMCMHDLKGNFLSINSAGASSIGYSVDEVTHINLLDLVPAETKDLTLDYLNEIENTGSSKGLMKIIHKSGALKTWMYNNVLSEQLDGSKFVIGTAVDITERIQLEKELKESNSRFFKIFDKNPVIMVISNLKTGKIEYVNETFLEIFGFTKEEVIGKTSVELNILPADEREKIVSLLKKQSNVRSAEGMMTKKNGEKFWVLTSLEIIEINGDFFILSSLNNIDDRKKMEEQISRLAEFQNVILDGTDYSIISTSESGIIKSFNKGAVKMLGYKAEEMLGITPEIIHDKQEVIDRAKVLSEELKIDIEPGVDVFLVKSRLNNSSDINEWTYILKDGSRIPVELSVTTLRSSKNEIVGYLGIAKDISESKKAKEEIINARAKAEQAVIAKNSFLANMSHEIRTPMNAIIGFTELLEQSSLDENQKECVSSVKLAGNNLLAIINDILDFSKIESGKITIENVPFSLKDALKNIYNLLNVKAKEKNLEYNFFIDASLPDFVVGDSVRLNQIMINLVGNAIKFTEEGSITVSVKKIEEDDLNYKLKFIVQDTGIGIPADKTESIFDRFSQANTETTRKFGGTGLGLSIAKNLVELLGGEIKLKSELGKGSEFSFEIRYHKVDKSVLEPLQKDFVAKKPIGPVKILLFEDNVLNQRLAGKILTKFGFDFEIAENGKIGLEKLKHGKFDLVLMDLQMPEMDGYQATIAIRNELKLQIPIIAMTPHSLVGEKEKCIEIGMNDYIGKPFTQDDLYNKISFNLIEKKQDSSAKSKIIGTGDANRDSNPIDLSYLKELSDGNKQFEKEMIELFLNQVPGDVSSLDVAFKNSDALQVKSLSHKLKSSITVVGLSILSPHLSFIEKNASNTEMNESSLEKFIFVKNTLNISYPLLQTKLKEEYYQK
ncbi:MAG: PAS domain S-box protein [Bacteroidia bacterium]|nr:PAS domain S-box protein [Bacteroidia bacterium]